MRIGMKLSLLAMLVTAAVAAMASSASAQTEPLPHATAPRLLLQQEVHNGNDVVCPGVTPSPPPGMGLFDTAGGCRVHLTGNNITLARHTAGGVAATLFTCNLEADIRVDLAGEGYLSHQELTAPPGACPHKACAQVTPPTSEGRPWSFHLLETEPAPRERAVLLFCTEAVVMGTPTHCELLIPMTETARHRYRLSGNNAPGHGAVLPRCEFTGTLDFETAGAGVSGEGQARQNVEIRHA